MNPRSRRKFLWLIRTTGIVLILVLAGWRPVRVLTMDLKTPAKSVRSEWVTVDERTALVCHVESRWNTTQYSNNQPLWLELIITFAKPFRGDIEYGKELQKSKVVKALENRSLMLKLADGSMREIKEADFGTSSKLLEPLMAELSRKPFYTGRDNETKSEDGLGHAVLRWNGDGTTLLCQVGVLKGYPFTGEYQINYSIVALAAWSILKVVFLRSVIPIIFLVILTSYRLWRWIDRGKCPECGYDLRGSGVEVGCPECGWGRL